MNHYVCFTGGRKYTDRESVAEVLGFLHAFYGPGLRVMHGAAPGLDMLVAEEADRLGITTKAFPAPWKEHGKAAGMVRNREMADYLVFARRKGHTVQIVAYPGGTGTQGMMSEGESRLIDVDRMAI